MSTPLLTFCLFLLTFVNACSIIMLWGVQYARKKIGELIAENREKKGLSQRQLAKAINISNAELSKLNQEKEKYLIQRYWEN